MVIALKEKPKVCVSVAKGSIDELRRDMKRAFNEGADFVEARIDALRAQEYASNRLERALSPFSERLIVTLRTKSEGGNFDGENTKASLILQRLAKIEPMLLDAEFDLVMSFPSMLKLNNERLLLSYHNWKETPAKEWLVSKLNLMACYGSDVKIVTTAKTEQDGARMAQLYNHVPKNKRLVAFAMGEKGKASRVASGLAAASPFTFAALDVAVAPGQMTLKEMQEIYRLVRR